MPFYGSSRRRIRMSDDGRLPANEKKFFVKIFMPGSPSLLYIWGGDPPKPPVTGCAAVFIGFASESFTGSRWPFYFLIFDVLSSIVKWKCKVETMITTQANQFFSFVQMRNLEILHSEDLASTLRLSKKQTQDLLSSLVKKGSIIRLKREIYLVPQKMPPGGKWQPESLYIVSHFMALYEAKYYVGGLYAFNHYGLSEQIPNIITVYNDKLSGRKKLGNLAVQLIKTASKKIDKPAKIKVKNDRVAYISTLPRTILDAVMDWSRFSTLPSAFDWLNDVMNQEEVLNDLVKLTVRFGNVVTMRRIGYFLATRSDNGDLVKPILKKLKPSKNWIPLNPFGERKGKSDKTWRVIDNVNERK